MQNLPTSFSFSNKLLLLIFLLIASVGFHGCEDDFEYKAEKAVTDSTKTMWEAMKSDTTMRTMVKAIERAGMQSTFTNSQNPRLSFFAVSDRGWASEFSRAPSSGYPNPYRNKKVEDIPVASLQNLINGLLLPKPIYSTSYPYPFVVTEQTLNPNVTLRIAVADNRYLFNVNAGSSAGSTGGRNAVVSNLKKSNGVIHIYNNFFSIIQ
jgi:hypothetical protein